MAEFKQWSGFSILLDGLDGKPLSAVMVVQPRETGVEAAKAVRDSLAAYRKSKAIEGRGVMMQRLVGRYGFVGDR